MSRHRSMQRAARRAKPDSDTFPRAFVGPAGDADEVLQELTVRFPGVTDLAGRDRDAILTAVEKAMCVGILRGTATVVDDLNGQVAKLKQTDPDANLPSFTIAPAPPIRDMWLEKYGKRQA